MEDQNPKIELKAGERIDDLQRNGYRIIQNEGNFSFGIDAVLLSGFTQVKEGGLVLDLGTGTGIIPLLLAAKTKGDHFTGIELSSQSADMAARSVELNDLSERITIVQGDIKEAGRLFAPASFDTITANPPYIKGDSGKLNPDPEKAAARHEIYCTLDDVTHAAAELLKPGGHFCMVHRPYRLTEIIRSLSEVHLEPKKMRLVYPFVDKKPNLVLLDAVRGGHPRLSVEKPLIVYEKPGVYTPEVMRIYEE